jgi:1,4-alpha-glucan branching enzyme
MITIVSPTSLLIDGIQAGAVADAIANNQQLASDIQRALVAYDDAQKSAHADALKAAVEKLTAEHAETLAKLSAERDAAKAEAKAALEQVEANEAFQKQILERAAVLVPQAAESGDWSEVAQLIAFAGSPFEEKKRLAELAEIERLESEAAERRAKLAGKRAQDQTEAAE